MSEKKRLLTGDRPTGKLHLGHYVGSIKNRVALQEKYECFFFLADLHTLTTKPSKEDILKMRDYIKEALLDWLACGIDPQKSTIFLQSAIPEVYEFNLLCEMFVSLNHLTGLPSLKEMARNAHIDPESLPFGLVGYPVLQTADILLPKANLVPVGKDNEAHVELARSIARRFNQLYGETLPLPEVLLSETPSLIGTDGQGKMSKSAGNCIYLSDNEKEVEKRVKGMYTDPKRVRADIPGTVEGNPVFIYLENFCTDKELLEDLKKRYTQGRVGDVEVKQTLTTAINTFLAPIRERREAIAQDKGYVEWVLYEGTCKMHEEAKKSMKEIRTAMGLCGAWNKISRMGRDYKERRHK